MRILNRPMFKYGGPIKEGIMHGMKNGGSMANNEGPRRAALVGNPIYPKVDGRTNHLAPLAIGAAAMRFLPAAYRGFKAARTFTPWSQNLGKWGRVKDIFLPRKGVTGPKMTGELYKTAFKPVSGAEKAGFGVGSFARTNPGTTFALASTVPQVGYAGAKIAKAAPGSIWEGTKRYADMVIPGDQSRWWKDKEPAVPGTMIGAGPLHGAKDIKKEKDKKDKTVKELAAEAKAARTKKLNKYLDTMGYDKAKKTAMGDALIDASAIVQDATTEAGSLKKADWGKMINQAIQSTSKRLDKPEQIREAVGLMMTKSEIEKDMTAEKDALDKLSKTLQIKGFQKSLAGSTLAEDIREGWKKSEKLPSGNKLAGLARTHGIEITEVLDTSKMPDDVAAIDYITEAVTESHKKGEPFPKGNYVIKDRLIHIDETGKITDLINP